MKPLQIGKLLWKTVFGQAAEITPRQLKAFQAEHAEGTYTLLDVRQPGEYEKSRLPGAKLIPLPQLIDRLGELDPNRPVVAY